MNYIIQNKNNIQSLYIVSLLLFLFILPNITLADNLYGQTCGNRTCSQDEVCQKQYRGVLPIGPQNTGNATYTCVKPQAIEAPESPYKGEIGCGAGLGLGSSFTSGLGSIGSGLLNSVTGGILGGTLSTSLNNIAGDFLGNPTAPFGIKLDGTLTGILNDPIGAFTGNFTDMIGLNDLVDECYYNNIDRVIDTRRLIAPLPVDLFNPLPLPVNVTSPNPLPVVVVDDLALYQQKELIDAPLANQQKTQTINTAIESIQNYIVKGNLLINNFFAIDQLAIQFGALDKQNGAIAKIKSEYASNPNFSIDKMDSIEQYFTDLRENRIPFAKDTFIERCGNIKLEEATTLECKLLGLQTVNNINDRADQAFATTYKRVDQGKDLFILEQKNGFLAPTKDGNLDPWLKTLTGTSGMVEDLISEANAATFNQAIVASEDRCSSAQANNILNMSVKPLLSEDLGFFQVDKTIASVLNNTINDPVNSIQNPQGFIDQLKAEVTGIIPNTNDLSQYLKKIALEQTTQLVSCQLNAELSKLLNNTIGNVNIPGIGNVNSLITNTVSNGVNNLVQDGVNNLIR